MINIYFCTNLTLYSKLIEYRKYSKITTWRKNGSFDSCSVVLFIEKMQLKMQLSQNLYNYPCELLE